MAMQDPHEAAKANPDLDKPMVLRSKDGSCNKLLRTEPSAPARPTTSSGAGVTSDLQTPSLINQVVCCGAQTPYLMHLWIPTSADLSLMGVATVGSVNNIFFS